MSAPLRILHVVIDDNGGSIEYARRLAVAGDRELVTSCAAILPLHVGEPRSTLAWQMAGVPVVELPALVGPCGLLRAVRALRSTARRADVIVTHTGAAGLVGRVAGWLVGRPVVHVAHNWPGATPDGGQRALVLGLLDMLLSPLTAAVVAPSFAMRRIGLAHGWVRRGRCGVIRYALDRAHLAERCDADRVAARATLGLPADAPVIAFCGRFDPVKGALAFIAAVKEVAAQHPGLIAVMAGDGPDRVAVTAAAEAAGCVRLLGWRTDVPRIFQAADIACVPSTSEALGIVVLESLAVGTPVVATRVGGLPEAVGPGGVLVTPADELELATTLDLLLLESELREHLGKLGRRWVERMYSGNAWAEAHLALWRRISRSPR
ncbi:MAG: glycosyltransferase family 4 protein [Planctomycetota bacterium]